MLCILNTIALTDATVYCGNLDERVTDAILWELFLQAGPVGVWRASSPACARTRILPMAAMQNTRSSCRCWPPVLS